MDAKDFEQLHLSGAETRQIVTPYAFKVSKNLLGCPLALPWQRAFALMVDIALVFLAAEISGEFVWLLVAYGLLLCQRKGAGEKLAWLWRGPMKFVAITVMTFAVLLIFSDIIDLLSPAKVSDDGKQVVTTTTESKPNITPLSSEALQQLAVLEEQREAVPAESKPTSQASRPSSLIAWFNTLIADLGLGFGWAAAYFSLFTYLWDGQTPGKRLVGVRVAALNGTPLTLWDSFGRYGGYGAGFATGLLGFLQIFWDPNRQCIHDKISNTVVIKGIVPDTPLAKEDLQLNTESHS
ncbi:RDD family protein [Pseudoalteromonas fenneropenaei]|uniref:RDD family protein n=1 Tax=Pseudoalteromonas fenneropenaei TaxID=1737459 RepID=A0ABV7CI42_9GAMM